MAGAYGKIRSEAISAAPKGTSEAGAIADFLTTAAGQQLWWLYNQARQAVDE